jgi:hypothetical protein
MKTDFEKYCDDCMGVLRTYTESLNKTSVSKIWKSIEDSPAGEGKIWLEDVLDKNYKERNPDTNFIYD